MKLPKEARATPGQPIKPAWEALQTFADQPEPKPIGTRVTEFPDETIYFTPRAKSPWPHPWKTGLSGAGAVLAPGLVNAMMPRAGRERLTLDGTDEDGKATGRRPVIEIDEPGDDGRSFLCVRVATLDGEAAVEALPLAWLTVVHRSTLPVGFASGLMPSVSEEGYEVGYFPLTVLYWSEDRSRVARILPFAYHHLQHRFVPGGLRPGGGNYPDRHDFRV
jgi:hypothetical protein